MTVWLIISGCLALAYVFTVNGYRRAWQRLPSWQLPPGFSPSAKISVVIAARDEAANLPACLNSLAAQNYPTHLFEVIVVDDHSTDDTLAVAQRFAEGRPSWKAIRSAAFGKKAAIASGIAKAEGQFIATTDADCTVPQGWLLLLAAAFEREQAKFIAAPVHFCEAQNLLQRFVALDFMGMMGVTGAGFQRQRGLLCNGANLAYPKAVFEAVGGFDGIDGMASGDDMLLLHKVAKRYPTQVRFLKSPDAAVQTPPPQGLRQFVSQRLRWASKSRSYEDKHVGVQLAVAYLACAAMLLSCLLAPWLGWPFAVAALLLFSAKTVVDFLFLGEVVRYFGRSELLRGYLCSQLLHIAYLLVIGTLANFVRRYKWKGRTVR